MVIGEESLSAIYVPLLAKGEVIGVVQVQSAAYNHLRSEDAEVLSFIASTAAVAIQNARLFEAERQQRTRAEALAQLAARLNAQVELAAVLQIDLYRSRPCALTRPPPASIFTMTLRRR